VTESNEEGERVKNNHNRIIMVDDNITNLTTAKNLLSNTYDVFTAPSATKLFLLLEKLTPDLILLDIEMPEMNGYEVIEKLKSNESTADIPVIFLTANIDPESEVKGLELGAIDYITKPFSRELLLKRIEVHLLIVAQRKTLEDYSQNLEQKVRDKTKEVVGLKNAILRTIAELVESRDNITGGHIERTQVYLNMLVGFLRSSNVYADEISMLDNNFFIMSSQLHDVGKIAIDDNILKKPGKLTPEEFEVMKKHTIKGMEIIQKIEATTPESVFLKYAKILAGTHHEKWDGSGYPFGLKGENIPLQGRLMAIIDVYDALTNDRPYKKAFSHEESMEVIRSGRGAHFDPLLCDIFLQYEKEFNAAKANSHINTHDGVEWELPPQTVATIMEAVEVIKNYSGDILQS